MKKDIISNEEKETMEYFIENVKKINKTDEYKNVTKKKYFIETFGCQMNENDSEKLAGMLIKMGYIKSDNKEDSQLIIFNTCCIRENAEDKVYGHLGALKKYKIDNPEVIIALCGCMMQQEEIVKYIYNTFRHVDIIFGTHNIHMLAKYIFEIFEGQERILDIWDLEGVVVEGLPFERNDNIKAWVSVMYGCNNFCTYCIVPYVRGRERSREVKEIIEEVNELAKKGYKEITLLGQNVNSYGKDLDYNISFANLLYLINDIKGIERIRFITSHPKDMSDELIKAIKECTKVCKSLHLPFQAGSTKVLKEMNRVYTKESYLKLIEKVKNEIPNISITTDIIVGFPGEMEKDFLDTLDIVKRVRFDSAYTFLYSKRTGTKAALRKDQISDKDKKKRFNELLKIQNEISNEINRSYLNKTVKVLVEGKSKNNPEMYTGRTDSNKVINFKGENSLVGKIIKVNVNSFQTWSLKGEII